MSTLPGGMQEVREIDLDLIDILNPRERNQKAFQEIVASIKALGLKKPIAVTPLGASVHESVLVPEGELWPTAKHSGTAPTVVPSKREPA